MNHNETEVLAQIGSIAVMCRAGLIKCPPESQGGFSVSWMRRRLLGSVNHERLSDSILRRLMAMKGFEPVSPGIAYTIIKDLNHEGGRGGRGGGR